MGRRRARSRRAQGDRTWARESISSAQSHRDARNAIRDLLDLDIDVTGWLPDDASYGFDNIAGVLEDLYADAVRAILSAAQKVSRTAIGIAPPSPTVDYFRVADDRAQEQDAGQLFGTRGGASIRYTFPMDATYRARSSYRAT